MSATDFELPWDDIEVVDTGVKLGIRWLTAHNGLYGAVNGYVKVPSWHPWFGLYCDCIPVDVHGGLTYGCNQRGWIGFDTLHAGDYWPDMPRPLLELADGRHWTPGQVAAETLELVHQVYMHAETALADVPPGTADLPHDLIRIELRARYNMLRLRLPPDPDWLAERAELEQHGWGPWLRRLEREAGL